MIQSAVAPPPEVARFLDPRDGTIRVFTFWLADTAYAVSIQHIHSVVQDDQDIRPVPSAAPGLLGTIWYHGAPVPVYD
ncbi:MAG: chemotaxis protein CheW, partial [Myxococcota bacterium]